MSMENADSDGCSTVVVKVYGREEEVLEVECVHFPGLRVSATSSSFKEVAAVAGSQLQLAVASPSHHRCPSMSIVNPPLSFFVFSPLSLPLP